jgi:hypothetical protein
MSRWLARGVRLTRVVDGAYRTFDRLRSTLVAGLASDSFFDRYNDLTYAASEIYRPDSAAFRQGLFDWEEEAVARFFPKPPARVLVGGAGGGREAFALVTAGYSVVAFDPAEGLVRGMRARNAGKDLRAYCGSYGTLPILTGLGGEARLDLSDEPAFDASIIGWSSFSHLRTDVECVDALQRFARLTRGPILVSCYPRPSSSVPAAAGGGLKGWLKRRADRHGASVFSVQIGYYRLLGEADVERLVRQAGLAVQAAQYGGNWPYVIIAGVAPVPPDSVRSAATRPTDPVRS